MRVVTVDAVNTRPIASVCALDELSEDTTLHASLMRSLATEVYELHVIEHTYSTNVFGSNCAHILSIVLLIRQVCSAVYVSANS